MAKNARPVALTIVRSPNARIGFKLETHGALDPTDRFNPTVQFLRALVAHEPVLIPVTHEADALLRW
jgi:hypothetical protein